MTDDVGDGLLLMKRLEELLRAFGWHLHPYVQEQPTSMGQFSWPEKTPIEGSVCFAVHPVDGDDGVMVERWTISCLRDFLYWGLGKAIDKGNAPRQGRLCGRWFFHEQGDKTVYCERIAPEETEKTCRGDRGEGGL